MSNPLMEAVPSVMGISPVMILNVVVLPAPGIRREGGREVGNTNWVQRTRAQYQMRW